MVKESRKLPISDLDVFRKGYFCIHVVLTNACNLRCGYCYMRKTPSPPPTYKQLVSVIDKVEQLNLQNVFYDLGGGEPLVRHDWAKVFNLFLLTQRLVSVNTNGTLIDASAAKKLSDLYKKYGEKLFLSVSLDSHLRTVNDSVRGRYDDVIRGMQLLTKYGVRYRVAITLTDANLPYITDTVKFVVENLTNECIIGVLRPSFQISSETQKLFVPLADVQRIHKHLGKMREAFKFELYHCLDSSGNTFCKAGIDRLAVLANGDIIPCYALQTNHDILGNIYRDSLEEIVRKAMVENSQRDPSVLLCEHRHDFWGKPPVFLGKRKR